MPCCGVLFRCWERIVCAVLSKGIAYVLPKAFSFEMDKNMHVKHPNQSSAFPCYPDNVTKPSPMFPLYPNLCSCVSIFQQNQLFNNVIDRFQYRFNLENGWGKQLSNALVMSSHFVFPLKISNLHQHCCSVEWHDDKRVRPWLQSCSATGDCFLGVSHAIFFEFRIWLIEKTYIVDGIGWTWEKLIFVRLCWNIHCGFELVQATSADLR